MGTGCNAHWLPIFTVEGCLSARKQDMKNFLASKQAKKTVSLTSNRLVLDNASVRSDLPTG
jgi:hypothetical protein